EVDAVDLSDADAVEKCADRQDERVGLRGHEAERDVDDEADRREHYTECDDADIETVQRAELHQCYRSAVEDRREDEQQQFEVALPSRHPELQADSAGEGIALTG